MQILNRFRKVNPVDGKRPVRVKNKLLAVGDFFKFRTDRSRNLPHARGNNKLNDRFRFFRQLQSTDCLC